MFALSGPARASPVPPKRSRVRQDIDQFGQFLADLTVLDPRKGDAQLLVTKAVRNGPGGLSITRTRILREEEGEIDTEAVRHFEQRACADPVPAGLIFVNLLVCQAQLGSERGQRHLPAEASRLDPIADAAIQLVC